jgi:hypothetical protein
MIHYFNPGHETAVHNASPYYMAPANVAAMQTELAYLLVWYAHYGDRVLVSNEKDRGYNSFLSAYFDILPTAITKRNLIKGDRDEVQLWGISPQAIHFFQELNEKYDCNLQLPRWSEELIFLNSRQSAHNSLSELIESIPDISSSLLPQVCTSLDEIEQAVDSSSAQLLAKAPYSSSGRGLLWLPVGGLTRTERQILHGILKKQKIVLLEKVVDKQVDFALEFVCDGKCKAAFEGYSLFKTNNKGAYQGNYLGRQEDIHNQLVTNIDRNLLEEVKMRLTDILSSVYAPYYNGCVGVDMMLYKENNEIKIHPCVEINMRYNMGYLAVCFSKNYLYEGSSGQYNLDFSAKEGEIYESHRLLSEKYPLVVESGRIKSGYLSLCPVYLTSHYRAYVLVESE